MLTTATLTDYVTGFGTVEIRSSIRSQKRVLNVKKVFRSIKNEMYNMYVKGQPKNQIDGVWETIIGIQNYKREISVNIVLPSAKKAENLSPLEERIRPKIEDPLKAMAREVINFTKKQIMKTTAILKNVYKASGDYVKSTYKFVKQAVSDFSYQDPKEFNVFNASGKVRKFPETPGGSNALREVYLEVTGRIPMRYIDSEDIKRFELKQLYLGMLNPGY